jgi:hypothetical protein
VPPEGVQHRRRPRLTAQIRGDQLARIKNPLVRRVFGHGFDVMAVFEDEDLVDILGIEFENQDFVRGIRMWGHDTEVQIAHARHERMTD